MEIRISRSLTTFSLLLTLFACKSATCPGGAKPVEGLCKVGDGGTDGADAGTCVSKAETCNREDDDCDDIIDEGVAVLSGERTFYDEPDGIGRGRLFSSLLDGYVTIVGSGSIGVGRVNLDGTRLDSGDRSLAPEPPSSGLAASGASLTGSNEIVLVRAVRDSFGSTFTQATLATYAQLTPPQASWHTLPGQGVDLIGETIQIGEDEVLLETVSFEPDGPGVSTRLVLTDSRFANPRMTVLSGFGTFIPTGVNGIGPILVHETDVESTLGHFNRASMEIENRVPVGGGARFVDIGDGQAVIVRQVGSDIHVGMFDTATLRCSDGTPLFDCDSLWVAGAGFQSAAYDGGRILVSYSMNGQSLLHVVDRDWNNIGLLVASNSAALTFLLPGSDHGVLVQSAASNSQWDVRIYGCAD